MRNLLASVLLIAALAPAAAEDYRLGDIAIVHPWARATPKGASVAAGYIDALRNDGAEDMLIGVSAEIAASASVHEMKMDNGVMQMRALPALTIPAKATVALAPSGVHVMFEGLKAPLKVGDRIAATLSFAHAGDIRVEFLVQPIGAKTSGAAGAMDAMPGLDTN